MDAKDANEQLHRLARRNAVAESVERLAGDLTTALKQVVDGIWVCHDGEKKPLRVGYGVRATTCLELDGVWTCRTGVSVGADGGERVARFTVSATEASPAAITDEPGLFPLTVEQAIDRTFAAVADRVVPAP